MMNETFFTIIGIIYILLATIICILSLTIMIIILYYWRSKCRSTANLIVCNSAVALLFYAIMVFIQIPFIIQNNSYQTDDQVNYISYKIRSMITVYAALVKTYSYLIMAISCFFTIILHQHPFFLSFSMHWILITISWIFSAFVTVAVSISPYAYACEAESRFCFLTIKNFSTSFTAMSLVFVTTLSIMVILYGIIMLHITRWNRINPNSISTIRAKRNMKVFKKIFIYVGTLFIGGTPYYLCIILHRVGQAPEFLYSIAYLFIAISAALDAIILFLTNEDIKTILRTKIGCRQRNLADARLPITINKGVKIVPYQNKIQTIDLLPTIN